MKIQEIERQRQIIQKQIDAGKSIDSRRKMGQFATPNELARDIVSETIRYLPDSDRKLIVLEPSMGTGSFASAALAVLGERIQKVQGYELDPAFHSAACELWNGSCVEPVLGDFLRLNGRAECDLVLANPPYSRHHTFGVEEKHRLQSLVKKECGLSISGLAGLYCYFLLHSPKWMKPGAIGAWLIPSEWMSVNYGSAIRDFLTTNVKLLRIHIFDANDVRFSDALVSSCVVWIENSPPDAGNVEITHGASISCPIQRECHSVAKLKAAVKWPPRDVPAENSWKLGDFFQIRRGIVTGDNHFFVMDEAEVLERKIPTNFLRPILPSPRHLKVNHVESDSNGIPNNADRRFLLDCTGYTMSELPESVKAYLCSGENTTAKKNLCASRNVWYEQEQRKPTKFLCSYMGRGTSSNAPVRFILNESKAIVSNSFLMLYPKGQLLDIVESNRSCAKEVWSLLLKIPPSAIFTAGRTYGGGLQKVEPNELASIPCHALYQWLHHHVGIVHREESTGQLKLF